METQTKKEDDLSAGTAANDIGAVLRAVYGDEPPLIVLVEHSIILLYYGTIVLHNFNW
jgi:hypothetical protein